MDINYVVMERNGVIRMFQIYDDNSAREVGSGMEIPDFADYWLQLNEDGWFSH